VIKKKKKT